MSFADASGSTSETSAQQKKISQEMEFSEERDENKKPSTIAIICQAIESLKNAKKGASAVTIKKWIIENYTDVGKSLLNSEVKNALAEGLENGILIKDSRGGKGCFLVNVNDLSSERKETESLKRMSEGQTDESEDKIPETRISDSEVDDLLQSLFMSKLTVSDSEVLPSEKKSPKSVEVESKPQETETLAAEKVSSKKYIKTKGKAQKIASNKLLTDEHGKEQYTDLDEVEHKTDDTNLDKPDSESTTCEPVPFKKTVSKSKKPRPAVEPMVMTENKLVSVDEKSSNKRSKKPVQMKGKIKKQPFIPFSETMQEEHELESTDKPNSDHVNEFEDTHVSDSEVIIKSEERKSTKLHNSDSELPSELSVMHEINSLTRKKLVPATKLEKSKKNEITTTPVIQQMAVTKVKTMTKVKVQKKTKPSKTKETDAIDENLKEKDKDGTSEEEKQGDVGESNVKKQNFSNKVIYASPSLITDIPLLTDIQQNLTENVFEETSAHSKKPPSKLPKKTKKPVPTKLEAHPINATYVTVEQKFEDPVAEKDEITEVTTHFKSKDLHTLDSEVSVANFYGRKSAKSYASDSEVVPEEIVPEETSRQRSGTQEKKKLLLVQQKKTNAKTMAAKLSPEGKGAVKKSKVTKTKAIAAKKPVKNSLTEKRQLFTVKQNDSYTSDSEVTIINFGRRKSTKAYASDSEVVQDENIQQRSGIADKPERLLAEKNETEENAMEVKLGAVGKEAIKKFKKLAKAKAEKKPVKSVVAKKNAELMIVKKDTIKEQNSAAVLQTHDSHISDSELTIVASDRRKSAKSYASDSEVVPDETVRQRTGISEKNRLLTKQRDYDENAVKMELGAVGKEVIKKFKKQTKAKAEKKPAVKSVAAKNTQLFTGRQDAERELDPAIVLQTNETEAAVSELKESSPSNNIQSEGVEFFGKEGTPEMQSRISQEPKKGENLDEEEVKAPTSLSRKPTTKRSKKAKVNEMEVMQPDEQHKSEKSHRAHAIEIQNNNDIQKIKEQKVESKWNKVPVSDVESHPSETTSQEDTPSMRPQHEDEPSKQKLGSETTKKTASKVVKKPKKKTTSKPTTASNETSHVVKEPKARSARTAKH